MNLKLKILTFASVIVHLYADLSLTLLHTNDIHARFDEVTLNAEICKDSDRASDRCVGGVARIAQVVKSYRRLYTTEDHSVLYLDAGDIYTGSIWFNVHKWKIAADVMKQLRPDAVCLGNHDFDEGIAGLIPYVDTMGSSLLVANLDFTNEPSLYRIQKSLIREINGIKIGIIGYITTQVKVLPQVSNIIVKDEVESLIEESERLEQMGVKIIIALGHSGFKRDQEIAAAVPLIDIVVGGHSHTFIYNGNAPGKEIPEDTYPKIITQPSGKQVPVVTAYAFSKYIGILNVTFDDEGNLKDFAGNPYLLSNDVPQDEDMVRIIDKYRPEVEELLNRVVGKTLVDLDASDCRTRECNLGSMVADAFVLYLAKDFESEFWTKYPVGLVNGGTFREGFKIQNGNNTVTYGSLIDMMPFGGSLATCRLKGKDLLETIEIGMRGNGETSRGEFLQVSGLHMTYNMLNPVNNRAFDVLIRCANCTIPTYEDIQDDAYYGIVTHSFLLAGGDGHEVLKNKCLDKDYFNVTILDVMSWYFGKYSPVYSEMQDRIKPFQKSSAPGSHINGVSKLLLCLILLKMFLIF